MKSDKDLQVEAMGAALVLVVEVCGDVYLNEESKDVLLSGLICFVEWVEGLVDRCRCTG